MRAMKTHRSYDSTFREDAIALVRRSERNVGAVAADLGIPEGTLWSWYYKAEMAKKKGGKQPSGTAKSARDPTTESNEAKVLRLEAENTALRKENEALKLDRAILKKAAAFFVKESE
jgi:transposase